MSWEEKLTGTGLYLLRLISPLLVVSVDVRVVSVDVPVVSVDSAYL